MNAIDCLKNLKAANAEQIDLLMAAYNAVQAEKKSSLGLEDCIATLRVVPQGEWEALGDRLNDEACREWKEPSTAHRPRRRR